MHNAPAADTRHPGAPRRCREVHRRDSRDPSPRQVQALAFIRLYLAANGYAPTRQEIADVLGVKSLGYVTVLLDELENRKLITRDRYRTRGITLANAEDSTHE